VIWQLMFPCEGLVAGLKRFPATRSASIFCIDASTGMTRCDAFVPSAGAGGEMPVGDGWMIGLETTRENLLFCHAYQPGSPEHQGIWAVDLPGGTVLWSRPDLVFAANLGERFLVYKTRVFAGFPERDYRLIDPRTGREIDEGVMEAERANRLRQEAESEQERQGILLPVAGLDETGGYAEIIDFGEQRVTARHALRAGESAAWDSFLEISSTGIALYEDTMASSVPAPVFNNFLLRAGRLYYIREKGTLISVEVS
jgi:hypothetical protein